MNITLNGESKHLSSPTTITQLISQLGVEASQVAVERNGEIVPKSVHAETMLAEGDRVELVRFIGGG